jgi:hypothetical protein
MRRLISHFSEQLFDLLFHSSGVTSVCSNWQAQSPQRLLFSTLCRRSVGSVDSALDDVLPVLASCAHPDADKTLRIRYALWRSVP